MTISVTPLATTFAATCRGVDLRNPVTEAEQAAIQSAFGQHGVLVLPDQDIGDELQMAFTRGFGELESSVRHGMDGSNPREELV